MSAQTETTDIERELEHSIDETVDETTELATLSERQSNRLQMQEIKRRTVKPGMMRLNVKRVVSSDSNTEWAIDLAHPAHDDDIRVFVEKPIEGWSRDYLLVRMLDWYGINNQDPHQLALENVYVEKNDEESDYAHGWQLVKPPEYDAPVGVQLREKWDYVLDQYRPSRSVTKMWFLLLLASIGSSTITAIGTTSGIIESVFVSTALFALITVLGMAVMDK